jgi:hypothetical protein
MSIGNIKPVRTRMGAVKVCHPSKARFRVMRAATTMRVARMLCGDCASPSMTVDDRNTVRARIGAAKVSHLGKARLRLVSAATIGKSRSCAPAATAPIPPLSFTIGNQFVAALAQSKCAI